MPFDYWSMTIALTVGAVVLIFLQWCHWSRHFVRCGVPYIPPWPIVGNTLGLVFNRPLSEVITELYKNLMPQPYAGIFLFTVPVIMVRDPEIIRTIAIKDFDHFTDHMEIGISDKENPLLERMLFALKGKDWHNMRITLSPAFTSMKIKNMFKLTSAIGHQMLEYLGKKSKEISPGTDSPVVMEMKEFFTRITNDVIATTTFGLEVDSLSEPDNVFYRMAFELENTKPLVNVGYLLSSKLMELLGIPLFNPKAVGFFKSIVLDTIQTREREGIVRHDMIHLLMQARHGHLTADETDNENDKGKSGAQLTDDDLVAQAFIFFFAGLDTVSTLMTFCSYLLATNEDVQHRLHKEIDNIMNLTDGHPSYEDVMGCQYLDMVISETMRIYAPASLTDRKCVRAYKLPATDTCPGVDLKPGDDILIPLQSIQCDPKYFPEPDHFNPERFSPENKHLIKPFTYIPFGAGPRICIGQRFALMESKVILTYLLSQFNLKVIPKTPVPPKLVPRNNISVSIKGGAWIGLQRRFSTET